MFVRLYNILLCGPIKASKTKNAIRRGGPIILLSGNMIYVCISNHSNREGWPCADPTCVSLDEPNEPTFSPIGPPRVLNNPVRRSGRHQQHGMVEIRDTVIEYPTLIQLPVGGINPHCQRPPIQSILHISTARDLDSTGEGVLSAADGAVVGDGLVGVFLFGGLSPVLYELQAVEAVASVAAVVLVGGDVRAVHQLLRGEGDAQRFFVGQHLVGLVRGSGGERPAGATLTLVLDGGDATLGAPVHVSDCDFVGDGHFRWAGEFAQVVLREFLISYVGELVDTHSVTLLGVAVVLEDPLHVAPEDGPPIGILLALIDLPKVGLELLEAIPAVSDRPSDEAHEGHSQQGRNSCLFKHRYEL